MTIMPIIILAVSAVAGVAVALYIAKRVGRFLNFRTMLLLNYVAVNAVSGIAHLVAVPDTSRGYYDLLATSGGRGIEFGVYACLIGLVTLSMACLRKLPVRPSVDVSLSSPWLVREEKRFILIITLIMLPLALMATLQIQGHVETLDSARVISLTDGNARFSYMSNWLAWSISFLAIALVASTAGRSRVIVVLVASGAVLGISGALAWTGGRSIIIIMVLPIVLILLPKLRGIRWFAVPLALVATSTYLFAISEKRSSSMSDSSLVTWLDWEWGRFSMMGFADEYVSQHGYMFGETFLAGISSFTLGTFRLFGLYVPSLDLQSSTQVSGESLRYSSDILFIVPGMSAELYLNFGLVGIAIGYYFLGRITSWADRKFLEAPTVIIKLCFAYVGTILVLRTVSADSGSIFSYLLYTGAPLVLALICSRAGRRKAAVRGERTRVLVVQHGAAKQLRLDRLAERKAPTADQESQPGLGPIALLRQSAPKP